MADHSDEKHIDKKTDKHATDESPGPSSDSNPLVSVVMGSRSDWETMKYTHSMLTEFGIPHETMVVSAHRTPKFMYDFAEKAQSRGFQIIIAGAGGAAHLPGMVASLTSLPVIGVPIAVGKLNGLDSIGSPLAYTRSPQKENPARRRTHLSSESCGQRDRPDRQISSR